MSNDYSIYVVPSEQGDFYKAPKDPNQKIWRYLDFPKFISLLYSKELFFPRASLFEDRHEGAVSQGTINLRQKYEEENIRKAQIDMNLDESNQSDLRKVVDKTSAFLRNRQIWKRNWTYVSCWHMNDSESAAMWKLYSGQSIAIQTNYKKLYNCLYPALVQTNKLFRIGIVNYIDYQSGKVPEDFILSEYFFKRKSFSHEAELRIVLQDIPSIIENRKEDGSYTETFHIDKEPIDGISFNLNLNELIDEVYIAPTSPDWLFNALQDVLKKYSYSQTLIRSSLDIDPLF
ncbi:DUF2971 domain-containing protein [soil metagenome]